MSRPSGLRDARLLERYGHEIEKALSTLDTGLAVACTNALAREAMGFPGVRGYELTELVRSAGSLFALRLGLEGERRRPSAPRRAFPAGRTSCLTA